MSKAELTYASSGVSFDANEIAMNSIKSTIESTYRPEVLSHVGSFGGLFQLGDYNQPVLVSSTDSVGTKLKLAFMTGRYDTTGFDLVSHCGNDIVVQGAEPLFFLDYIGTGKLSPEVTSEIVNGLAKGCLEIGCALIGGETAELPGFYNDGEYDLVGTIVGVVERDKVITGNRIEVGDLLIGLSSMGLHTNGFSLARKIVFEHCGYEVDRHIPELGTTIGDELLRNHKSYVKAVLDLRKHCEVKGLAHITGGGLPDNLIRILPKNCQAVIRTNSWCVPPIFSFLQVEGNVSQEEMFRVFNMGIGLVIVVPRDHVDGAMVFLEDFGETPFLIGEIVSGEHRIEII
ncbi:MAG: phosphoribosylformylglycinamidine cyclo-ligase [Candidatus Poribacteria bacterium]|jgi:phosphoribosylformylglycinamidine cyclo-ligase|nr:phosphoribosylformylglycinamidine cyclo-ligase [Candidatus Poribacteria bacterium]|tara:strand:- start:229 stop:1260 length:1032 start_codon:yes stop_codon:yes gene_type:complete